MCDFLGLRLLTVAEFVSHKDVIFHLSSDWWLADEGVTSHYVSFVRKNGDLSKDGHNIKYPLSLRPCLMLGDFPDYSVFDVIIFGGFSYSVLSNDIALCDSKICEMPFRKYVANDGYDGSYDRSDIKYFLDSYFEENKNNH